MHTNACAEMLAVEQLHANAADGRPIVVFNGELDRIRRYA